MTKLSPNFEIDRYGLHCRLVDEGDVDFILSLRTDPILSRFLHQTENNRDKQIAWIREYKQREQLGQDYYFIFSYQDSPMGLIRISNINLEQQMGTLGSWLCVPHNPIEKVLATVVIGREILFEELGLQYDCFDVRKGNKKVQRMHAMFGAEIVREDELNYYYVLKREDFENNKKQILDLLNIE